MADCMTFPKTADEFIEQYSFKDDKQEYTNGSELIAVFRVKQMIEHYFAKDTNVPSWIPVTERLPEKMGQCVCRYVFGENTDYPFFQVLWYYANLEKPHFQHEGSMGLTVTHWMPLPEPPKEGE